MINKKKTPEEFAEELAEELSRFTKKIAKHNDDIWTPDMSHTYKPIDNNTWFTICEYENKKHNNIDFKSKEVNKKTVIKSKKVLLKLNLNQRKIIDDWLESYRIMYNKTLNLIKKRYFDGKKTIINFRKLRTKYLKDYKETIRDFYKDKNTIAKSHHLDYAIKLVCSNYKSAFTNYKNGNIQHFRMRYWKHTRSIKTMDIESCCFSKTGFCYDVFGKIDAFYKNKVFDLSTVKKNCKLSYNSFEDRYYLFVPIEVKQANPDYKYRDKYNDKVIACDPGVRKFMTCISENKAIKIGEKCANRIQKYLEIIDKRNNMTIPRKIKKKNEKLYNKKISNLVDELHWTTIKYMTENYNNILIGDMSVKGIVNNKTSNISPMTKRLAYKLRFYQFRQRLTYKCVLNKIPLKVINEWYTSKACSKCGNLKNNLEGAKKYECRKCGVVMDRDINGARGILIKAL
jgi:putative transposase